MIHRIARHPRPRRNAPCHAPHQSWVHQHRGFYYDGCFATLQEVIHRANTFFKLEFTDEEVNDLNECLKSL